MNDKNLEIDCLKKEIIQLKQDKDFVWSLWKRLQVSSPDLTNAINLVVDREKQRNEIDKQTMLKELKEKNEENLDLQRIIQEKSKDIDEIKAIMQDKSSRVQLLEQHCANLSNKAEQLSQMMEQTSEHQSNQQQSKLHQQKLIDSYEQERKELQSQISQMQSSVATLTRDKTELRVKLMNSQEEAQSLWSDKLHDAHCTIAALRDQLQREEDRTTQLDAQLEQYKLKLSAANENVQEQNNRELVTPVEDLNYKVERLSLHMQHLEDSLNRPRSRNNSAQVRSKSIPGKLSNRQTQMYEDMARKVDFLTMKLNKTQVLLDEEKKSSDLNKQYLDKSQNKLKTLQITLKQLRSQIEDNQLTSTQLKEMNSKLEDELESYKTKNANLKDQLERLKKHSVTDGTRIQEILSTLENTRTEITSKFMEKEAIQESELTRLQAVIRNLELDNSKLALENRSLLKSMDNSTLHMDVMQRKFNLLKKENGDIRLRKSKVPVTSSRKLLFGRGKSQCTRIRKMPKILGHFSGEVSSNGDKAESADDINAEEEKEDASQSDDSSEKDEDNTDNVITGQESHRSLGEKIADSSANRNPRRTCDSQVATKKNHRINSRAFKQGVQGSSDAKQASSKHITRIRSNSSNQKARNTKSDESCGQCFKLSQRIRGMHCEMRVVFSERDQWKSQAQKQADRLPQLHKQVNQLHARNKRLTELSQSQSIKLELLQRENKQLINFTDNDNLRYDMPDNNPCGDSEYIGSVTSDDYTAGIAADERNKVIKQMEKELNLRDVELRQQRQKIAQMDREMANKRKLIGEQRNKLALLETGKDAENKLQLTYERKLKDLEDQNFKMKIQFESNQSRLNVLLEERKRSDYELSRVEQSSDQYQQKCKELQNINRQMELQMSRLQRQMDQKLTDVVQDNSQTLKHLNMQVSQLKNICRKYKQLILALARSVTEKTREIQRLIGYGRKGRLHSLKDHNNNNKPFDYEDINPSSDGLLDVAKSRAADILSLTSDEMDSLLSSSDIPQRNNNNDIDLSASGGEQLMEGEVTSLQLVDACKKALAFPETFDTQIQDLFSTKLNQLVDLIASPQSAYDSGCTSN